MSDIESIPIKDENKPNYNQIKFPIKYISDIIKRNSYLYIGLGVKARVYLKNIEHKTPIMRIEFGCTEIIKYKDKDNGAKYCGFNICLELEKTYSEFLTELKTDIINYCSVHSSYLECPHNKRILDNLYKLKVYKKDALNVNFGNSNDIDIDIYSTTYININGLKKFKEPIQVKTSDINYLKKVLKRGTIVQLVIDIPYFDIYDTQIRPCIKVQKIIIYII